MWESGWGRAPQAHSFRPMADRRPPLPSSHSPVASPPVDAAAAQELAAIMATPSPAVYVLGSSLPRPPAPLPPPPRTCAGSAARAARAPTPASA